jgi:hypothetical protein
MEDGGCIAELLFDPFDSLIDRFDTPMSTIRLAEIAHARSGDKGTHANVGVIAFTPAGYEFLGRYLTESRMAEYFLPLRPKQVERFALPGILAYNFLLYDILAGGASRSLRTDSQGKVLSAAVLEMPIPAPPNLSEMLRKNV